MKDSDEPYWSFAQGKVQAEWGSSTPVRWLSEENVTVYDGDGNEITESECGQCGKRMKPGSGMVLLGENAQAEICKECMGWEAKF